MNGGCYGKVQAPRKDPAAPLMCLLLGAMAMGFGEVKKPIHAGHPLLPPPLQPCEIFRQGVFRKGGFSGRWKVFRRAEGFQEGGGFSGGRRVRCRCRMRMQSGCQESVGCFVLKP